MSRQREREREEHAISPLTILSFICLLTSGLPARPTAYCPCPCRSILPFLLSQKERRKEKRTNRGTFRNISQILSMWLKRLTE